VSDVSDDWSALCLLILCWFDNAACHCVTMKRPASATGYGTVTSPNYPRVYSPGISCVLYSISARVDQIVELQFVDFNMAPPFRNRCDSAADCVPKKLALIVARTFYNCYSISSLLN